MVDNETAFSNSRAKGWLAELLFLINLMLHNWLIFAIGCLFCWQLVNAGFDHSHKIVHICYGIHHCNTSARQVTDNNDNVNGNHVEDSNGTIGFVLALLYNMICSQNNYGNPMEEDTGKHYMDEW
jgi:hypothetical protein